VSSTPSRTATPSSTAAITPTPGACSIVYGNDAAYLNPGYTTNYTSPALGLGQSGSGAILIVVLGAENPVSGVTLTYGGLPMSALGTQVATGSGTSSYFTVYYLSSPVSGGALHVTGTGLAPFSFLWFTYGGVSSSAPFGTVSLTNSTVISSCAGSLQSNAFSFTPSSPASTVIEYLAFADNAGNIGTSYALSHGTVRRSTVGASNSHMTGGAFGDYTPGATAAFSLGESVNPNFACFGGMLWGIELLPACSGASPTLTPSATATWSPTPSVTATQSPSGTLTATGTETELPSATVTASPTNSPSATATESPVASPSSTVNPTAACCLSYAGEFISSTVAYPYDLQQGASGRIYVGSQTSNFISIYSSAGSPIGTVGSGELSGPALSAAEIGNRLYVLDGSGNRVLIYDAVTLAFVGQWPLSGVTSGNARNLVPGPDGKIYVATTEQVQIHVFDLDGTPLRQFGPNNGGYGNLSFNGSELWLASFYSAYRFDAQGDLLQTVDVSSGFNSPYHQLDFVTHGPDGHIFSTGWHYDGVYEHQVDGSFLCRLTQAELPSLPVSDVSMGQLWLSNGDLLVASNSDSKILRFSLCGQPSATVTFTATPSASSTFTSTFSFTSTASATPTATGTPSATATPTQSGTATVSGTPIGTPQPFSCCFQSAFNVPLSGFDLGIGVGLSSLYVTDLAQIKRYDLNGQPLGAWGSWGNGPGQFNGMRNIAVVGNDVYVSDPGNNRVQQFDASGAFIRQWGSAGSANGQFSFNFGIAWAPLLQRLYVTDTSNNRVQSFQPDGTFIAAWGSSGTGPGQFQADTGIAVGPDGTVYVGDASGRIQAFDADGNFLRQWSTPGATTSITVRQGVVLAAISGLSQVFAYDTNGNQLCELTAMINAQVGSTSGTRGLAWDASGRLFVGSTTLMMAFDLCSTGLPTETATVTASATQSPTQTATATISASSTVTGTDSPSPSVTGSGTTTPSATASATPTPAGSCCPVFNYSLGHSGSNPGEFGGLLDVAVDAAGNIYTAEGLGRVQVFDAGGTWVRSFGGSGAAPYQFQGNASGIAVDLYGHVVVVDQGSNLLKVFTTTGAFVRTVGTVGTGVGQEDDLFDVTVDALGNIYALNYGDNITPGKAGEKVLKFDSAGNFLQEWTYPGWVSDFSTYDPPLALAYDPQSGTILVKAVQAVDRFSLTGVHLATYPAPAGRSFPQNFGLAVDSLGQFYAGLDNQQVLMANSSGGTVCVVGQPGDMASAFGLAASTPGNFLLADVGYNRLSRFSPCSSPLGTPTPTQTFTPAATFTPAVLPTADCGVASSASATYVLGQTTMSGSAQNQGGSVGASTIAQPYAVAAGNGVVAVADTNNSRVLLYNAPITSNGQSAFAAIGQSSPSATGGLFPPGAMTLLAPSGVAIDNGRMAVVDHAAYRVLLYNSIPSGNGAAADIVLGKTDPTDISSSQVPPSKTTLYAPWNIALADGHIFLADGGNHRVLIWNSWPTHNGQPADIVLGQPDFNQIANQTTSDRSTTDASGVWAGGGRLAIATQGRVLLYDSYPTSNYQPADRVVGQANFTDDSGPIGPIRIGYTFGVHFDGSRLYASDVNSHRVLIWNGWPTTNGQAADAVLGQPDFTSTQPNQGSSVSGFGMNFPRVVAHLGNQVFITDRDNNRVLVFDCTGSPAPSISRLGSKLAPLPTKDSVISAPNPSRGSMLVSVALTAPGHTRLQLMDLNGRMVLEKDLGDLPAGTQRLDLDLRGQASGLYFILVLQDRGEGWVKRASFKAALVR
jgi:sugar lactone lactonase YvrE